MSFKQKYDNKAKTRYKTGYHNGNHYRSSYEEKTMQALENFGIPYEYEPERFKLSNGVWYEPDFYLTEARMYIEVKRDQACNRDMAKVAGLVADTNKPVLVLGKDNAMLVMRLWNQYGGSVVAYDKDDIALACCRSCGCQWFYSHRDTHACPKCGAGSEDEGYDHLFDVIDPVSGVQELFVKGQDVASEAPFYTDLVYRFNQWQQQENGG